MLAISVKKPHSDKQNFTGIGFPCVENLNSNLVAPVLQATIASSRRSLLLQTRCLERSNTWWQGQKMLRLDYLSCFLTILSTVLVGKKLW
jgi:hypothetical protein